MKKRLNREYISRKINKVKMKIIHLFEPEYEYWQEAKQLYFDRTGKELDYHHPRDVNEKLMWLSRYWQHPLVVQCADKYRMREYIKDCGLEDILIPIYGVWEHADDIPFDELPNQFALKCNHGCGFNIICKDKDKLDINEAKKKIDEWLNVDFGAAFYEHHYSKVKPLVYCEQLIPFKGQSVIDYKIQCFNGKPYCFFVCTDRDNEHHSTVTFSSYSLEWEKIDLLKQEPNVVLPKPKFLSKMIKDAEIIAAKFPYVRVDYYETNDHLYLGELTFTPQGNVMDYYKDEVLDEMGKLLVLPKKYHA